MCSRASLRPPSAWGNVTLSHLNLLIPPLHAHTPMAFDLPLGSRVLDKRDLCSDSAPLLPLSSPEAHVNMTLQALLKKTPTRCLVFHAGWISSLSGFDAPLQKALSFPLLLSNPLPIQPSLTCLFELRCRGCAEEKSNSRAVSWRRPCNSCHTNTKLSQVMFVISWLQRVARACIRCLGLFHLSHYFLSKAAGIGTRLDWFWFKWNSGNDTLILSLNWNFFSLLFLGFVMRAVNLIPPAGILRRVGFINMEMMWCLLFLSLLSEFLWTELTFFFMPPGLTYTFHLLKLHFSLQGTIQSC